MHTDGSKQQTHLFQHDLGVLEVVEHGLNVGLIGGPGHEAPGDPLHSLHGARRQQLGCAECDEFGERETRRRRRKRKKKKSGVWVAQQ